MTIEELNNIFTKAKNEIEKITAEHIEKSYMQTAADRYKIQEDIYHILEKYNIILRNQLDIQLVFYMTPKRYDSIDIDLKFVKAL